MMAYIGLGIIVLAWILQMGSVSKKNQKINPLFVGGYGLGVVFLVVDGVQSGMTTLALLNGLSLVAAVGTYWRLKQ